jgi:[ribosomal protein S18]-alanine N-acetyltransferase
MYTSMGSLECRVLSLEWREPLLTFFTALRKADETDNFYPHPFTDEAVKNIIQSHNNDLYYVLGEGKTVLGYGMLRGWDEGYEIPSLGIAIHPAARNLGLGRAFMHFLHGAARRRGATKVRLRVKSQNTRAVKLYESLGYSFGTNEGGYLVGFLDICGACSESGAESPQP